jgi:hypothetical protein
VLLLSLSPACFAQATVLNVAPPKKVTAKIGATTDLALTLQLTTGYHVNSNTPSDEYLIPLRITWNPGPLEAVKVSYPQPHMEKFAFSQKPLSIFSGEFEIQTQFKPSATATPGLGVMTGKLRYQACNDRMCLAPKTLDITVPVQIVR